jgi:hypothetical protein
MHRSRHPLSFLFFFYFGGAKDQTQALLLSYTPVLQSPLQCHFLGTIFVIIFLSISGLFVLQQYLFPGSYYTVVT